MRRRIPIIKIHPSISIAKSSLSIHALTRRSTVSGLVSFSVHGPFNSRPHKEVDATWKSTRTTHTSFQFTTSQGGRRLCLHGLFVISGLSIHDLTRRSTFRRKNRQKRERIFQFTTSQGGRQNLPCGTFTIPAFQFTTSQGGRLLHRQAGCIRKPFNSRPHKEVDARSDRMDHRVQSFNSRPHKEVDATVIPKSAGLGIFQFTTSQGGRHRISVHIYVASSFNSRPHKEVDFLIFVCLSFSLVLSIHDLTRRSTWISFELWRSYQPFNSRPHKEVDKQERDEITPYDLSIHDLTRRSTERISFPETIIIFQFTTSQGGRQISKSGGTGKRSFNSRPHKEVD